MADDLVEVVVKFFKTYVSVPILVDQGETKLVFLIVGTVTEHIHYICESFKNDPASTLTVENFKDSVSEKRVLLLAEETHLRPELFLIHGFDCLFLANAFLVYNYYFLFC